MTVADWALIISLGSVVISSAAFIWNVWSKFIYPKPTVRVSFQFVTLMEAVPGAGRILTRSENHALSLSATNRAGPYLLEPIGVGYLCRSVNHSMPSSALAVGKTPIV